MRSYRRAQLLSFVATAGLVSSMSLAGPALGAAPAAAATNQTSKPAAGPANAGAHRQAIAYGSATGRPTAGGPALSGRPSSSGSAAPLASAAPDPVGGTSANATLNGGAQTEFASPSWLSTYPGHVPTARGYAFSAYDSGRDRDVVFGGYSNGSFLSDTWEWDGRDWTSKSPTTSPSARDGEQMAYDPAIGKTVLFGGWNGSASLGDTWTWDGTTWTKLSPATSPGARGQGRLVYDTKIGKLVLFGGVGSVVYSDTWTFDGTTWTKLAATGPAARENQLEAYDSSNSAIVLYGGDTGAKNPKYYYDTWTFDGTSWHQQLPADVPGTRASGGMAWDSTLNRVVMFGGRDGLYVYDTLYIWTGTDWYAGAAPLVPGFRTDETFVQGAGHGELMTFGGIATNGAALSDTQLYDWDWLGDQKSFKFQSYTVDDREGMKVNVANGNLVVSAGDVKIQGVGLPIDFTRYYNSGSALISQDIGWGWAFTTGRDVYTSNLPDGSVVIFGLVGSGGQLYFHKNSDGSFKSPAGFDADLKSVNGNLELTYQKNNEKLTFTPGLLSSDKDRNGNTINYTYNGSEQLTQVTDTEGRNLSFVYNGDGSLYSITDWTGRTWEYGYSNGYLVQFLDPTGALTQYGYDSNGMLDEIEDPDGNLLYITYDSQLHVSSVMHVTSTTPTFTGPTASYSYTSADSGYWIKSKYTDENSHTTTYQAQYGGQVKDVTDALGHDRKNSYTADNNVAQLTDSLSAVYNLSYDNTNNLTKVQAPNVNSGTGPSTSFTYGNTAQPYQPDSMTDAQGNKTSYSYDTAGNLTTVTTSLASGASSTNNYQGDGTTTCGAKKGELCNTVDANGHKTSYSYNASGDLTKISPPSPLGATTIAPDALSRPGSVTDGKNQKATYTYDGNDRITQVMFNGTTTCTPSAGTCVQYTYDAAGNLTQRVDASGTTTYSYDYANRPTAKTTPQGSTSVTYDGVGNVTTYTDAGGTVSYGYDAVNNVTSVTEPSGAKTTMGYDKNNRRTSISYPNGVNVSLSYNEAGQEKKVSATRPGGTTTFVSRTYDYSIGGKNTALRWKVTDESSNATSYGYDVLGRLTSAVTTNSAGTQTSSYTFAYDAVGNRTSGPEGSHTYNAADELTDSGYTYDANGNLTAGGGRTFSYNSINQSTSITNNGASLAMSYADVDSTERTQAGGTSFLNGLLGMTRQTGSQTVSFTRDPNGNLISMRVGGVSYYYVVDAVGSVLRLTDGSGNDAASYAYKPYGETTSATGTMATTNPYRFAGGYWDATTALLKFGARYDDPKLGVWTQRDPVAASISAPGAVNRYPYVGDNPISASDPSGRDWISDALDYTATGLSVVGDALDVTVGPEVGGWFDAASVGFSFASAGYTCTTEGFGSSGCAQSGSLAGMSALTFGTSTGLDKLGYSGLSSFVSGYGLGIDLSHYFL
jgi:RHS repeat-associated protein